MISRRKALPKEKKKRLLYYRKRILEEVLEQLNMDFYSKDLYWQLCGDDVTAEDIADIIKVGERLYTQIKRLDK